MTRNAARKYIGKIRKKGQQHKASRKHALEENRRLAVHAQSKEIDTTLLHKLLLKLASDRRPQNHEISVSNSDSGNLSSSSVVVTRRRGPSMEFDLHQLEEGEKSILHSSESESPFHVFSSGWEIRSFFDVLHLQKVKSFFPSSSPTMSSSLKSKSKMVGYENNYLNSKNIKILNHQSDAGIEADADDEDDQIPSILEHHERFYHVFLFTFGSIVFWNFNEEQEEIDFINSLKPLLVQPFLNENEADHQLIHEAKDYMDYLYSSRTSVKHDLFKLGSRALEEKLAVSYALAQSNLLSVYEWRLDKMIQRNEHIPQEIADTGKTMMSSQQISQEIGKLFMERYSINLNSGVLDTPRFFWENDEWEPVYEMMCEYLEHENRIALLNSRLDCVRELLDVLETQVENKHSYWLEWIVIWLIGVEIFIQVFWNILLKDILGYFPHGDSD